jgi:hypothetical protein
VGQGLLIHEVSRGGWRKLHNGEHRTLYWSI